MSTAPLPGLRQQDVTVTRALRRAAARCQAPGCDWPAPNLPLKGDPTDDQSYAKNIRYAARRHALLWPGHVIGVDVVDHTEYVFMEEASDAVDDDVPDA